MKKFFMLMFCVVMAFALAGCSGSNEKNASQFFFKQKTAYEIGQ